MSGVAEVGLIAPRVAESLPDGPDWIFEWKYDGYRLQTSVSDRGVELLSRRGTNLTDLFPEISRSVVVQVPAGTVLDGELVAFVDGRLSFDALQQRMAAGVRRAADLGRVQPASLMVFDLLESGGRDVTGWSWRERRAAVEVLAPDWRPPLQLTPYTQDRDEALEWMRTLAPLGIEGVVAKRVTSRYRRGAEWIKVRSRETLAGIIGAVIGSINEPEALIIGQVDDGRLGILGRTSALSPTQAGAVGAQLRPPIDDHPWPAVIGSGHFGGPVQLTLVEPDVIAEVTADAAQMGGRRRHALRFVRLRLD
ncbi:MAG: ATP-dependent DNA ligase [Microlunatus sp.]|nr:ATP-dependent DNA ligase [Microlunatus sp.]